MDGLRYEVEDVIVEDARVALAYTLRARFDGHPVTVRGMFRFVVRDGLVAHRVDYWDASDFRRQVGET
jgi:hypothetical protein